MQNVTKTERMQLTSTNAFIEVFAFLLRVWVTEELHAIHIYINILITKVCVCVKERGGRDENILPTILPTLEEDLIL